ncbi:hypothetical protein ASD48_39660 [Streptomyces sp. Root1310]|nr:hypothetical protein ASD48_39660 [Streptomyces sp. Root1310]
MVQAQAVFGFAVVMLDPPAHLRTAIITDAVPLATRAKRQGLVDVSIAGATGGMSSGEFSADPARQVVPSGDDLLRSVRMTVCLSLCSTLGIYVRHETRIHSQTDLAQSRQ